MAEAKVSTILSQLTEITTEKASEAWRLVSGVKKEVERLESNFKAIQYELEDAEEKRYLDKRLEPWLERFKQVSYDMEDVIDDWKTVVQEVQAAVHDGETNTTCFPKWKACEPFVSCFSFGSQVVRRYEIATRMKEINKKLDQIVGDKEALQLIRRENIERSKRPESTSFVSVSKLDGREIVQEAIIKTLRSKTSLEGRSCIPTVTIEGMRGIGKTALAQLIYNDPIFQSSFSKKNWVCVSNYFDEKQIARAILRDLDPTIFVQNETSLQILLSKICEEIKGKKFFLVLDDVRTDRYQDWEQLKATFRAGMFGSRILVTTSNTTVASRINSYRVFPIKKLSDEICWKILSQMAFNERDEMRSKHLEDIGRKIAENCDGLPLVAEILGGLLQYKLERDDWQNVLNSEMWKSNLIQEHIYAPLLLSYNDLPSATRQCLLYCAIFPKNYEIGKDELIQHWMAQGYLNSDDNLGEDHFKCSYTHFFFPRF